MKNSLFLRLSCFALAILACSATARATAFSWDGSDSGTNLLWSNPLNWSADSGTPGSADTVTFGATGAAASGLVTSEVNANTTITALTFNALTTGTQQTIQIDTGSTLGLSAAGSGTILGVGMSTSAGSNTTKAAFTGTGALSVTGASQTINIFNASANSNAILDLSGLATFTANVSALRVADNTGSGNLNSLRGQIILAQDSTITATTISLGLGSASSQNHIALMDLGQTTKLNVGTLSVGGQKSQGTLSFQNSVVNGNLKIRGTGGLETFASNWNIGSADASSGSANTRGTVNLAGGSVDANVTNLRIGYANSSSSGAVTGEMSYGSGTINATTAYLGYQTAAGSGSTNSGTLTLSGSAILNGTNLYIGRNTNATNTKPVTGFLVVNGGTVTVTTTAVLGMTDTSSSTVASVSGELQINGGAVTINAGSGLQAGGDTTNAQSHSTLTLDGGKLDMTGKAIGSSASNIKVLNFRSGELANVAEINGGSTLTKTTTGVLTVSGTNTYTGATTVSLGTLLLNGTVTSDVTVGSSATLGGAGSTSKNILLNNGGAIAPGANNAIGTLSANNLTWDGGSTMKFQLSGLDNTSDKIALTTRFGIGLAGAYTFDFLGTGRSGGTYTLLTFNNTTFTDVSQFSVTNLGGSLTGTLSMTGSDLSLSVVPEPATWALLVAALGTLLVFRRRHCARLLRAE